MKGKKRKRSSPTHSPAAPSPKGPLKSSPPLLPYQLRPSSKRSPKSPKPPPTNSPPLISRMDLDFLETDLEDLTHGVPTAEEAEALLRDDDDGPSAMGQLQHPHQEAPLPESPTAAVKSAIEAQIAENQISADNTLFTVPDSNKDTSTLPTPAPAPQILIKKPLPLFPDGLPLFRPHTPNHSTRVTQSTNQPKTKSTYASKAKTPPKGRTLVEHILFVYSTWTNKAPIDAKDWGIVESHLLEMELRQNPSDPLIRIANSGYDATHKCGYIACRDQASAEWCKTAIRGIGGPQYGARGAFRAWAKGEQPEARLCRLFFPTRFDSLSEDVLLLLLKKHNPSFQRGTLVLKGIDDVQGGRALFVEFDTDSYSTIKAKNHKVEFSLMDIDCQIYNPPKRAAPTGPGISGIVKIVNPAQTQSQSVRSTPSSGAGQASSSTSKSKILDPRLAKTKTSATSNVSAPASPLKRSRCDTSNSVDGAKRGTMQSNLSD